MQSAGLIMLRYVGRMCSIFTVSHDPYCDVPIAVLWYVLLIYELCLI